MDQVVSSRNLSQRAYRAALGLFALLLLSACASLPSGERWGEHATYRPGWERVRHSAVEAVRDPWVWIPLTGAVALQIGDVDSQISDWAREHTPVFGSEDNAARWSDNLRSASVIAYHVSVLATPSGDDPAQWLESKAKGYVMGLAAIGLTSATTDKLKTTTDRERPNGADQKSLPSGHTSSSAVSTRLASRNLRSIDIDDSTERAFNVGLDMLTIGTAWARVEAGAHFPSDTLVSIALGNFMASFVNDAFLGLSDDPRRDVALVSMGDGAGIQFRLRF